MLFEVWYRRPAFFLPVLLTVPTGAVAMVLIVIVLLMGMEDRTTFESPTPSESLAGVAEIIDFPGAIVWGIANLFDDSIDYRVKDTVEIWVLARFSWAGIGFGFGFLSEYFTGTTAVKKRPQTDLSWPLKIE